MHTLPFNMGCIVKQWKGGGGMWVCSLFFHCVVHLAYVILQTVHEKQCLNSSIMIIFSQTWWQLDMWRCSSTILSKVSERFYKSNYYWIHLCVLVHFFFSLKLLDQGYKSSLVLLRWVMLPLGVLFFIFLNGKMWNFSKP